MNCQRFKGLCGYQIDCTIVVVVGADRRQARCPNLRTPIGLINFCEGPVPVVSPHEVGASCISDDAFRL